MLEQTLVGIVLFIVFSCSPAHTQSTPLKSGDEDALTAAAQGLCQSQVAMLGESATHGDGHTLAFKVALVERLVDQCGFDSVFFEASHYEFIHLNRRLRMRQTVTDAEISSAVGGLWEFNQEFQPLVPFLLAKAQAGSVFLGGIDDQLGEFGQCYANDEMVTELANLLPLQQAQRCSTALHKRNYNDYAEGSPYSRPDQVEIEACLSKMLQANARDKATNHQEYDERQEMISATQRWVSRDFSSDATYIVNRDRSMFQNFEWLLKRQPKRHKVIVWAATVHLSKQGDPSWADGTGTNFGSYVHRKYGSRAQALGFSALSGSFREPGRGIRDMPDAPVGSVEARVLHGNNFSAIYLGLAQLSAMGTVPAMFFRHSYETLSWSTFLDGAVVFREEQPPRRVEHK